MAEQGKPERMARCTYYGTVPNGRGTPHEKRGKPCLSEEPSAKNDTEKYGLAFFKAHPDKDHDEFYCGCWGWD